MAIVSPRSLGRCLGGVLSITVGIVACSDADGPAMVSGGGQNGGVTGSGGSTSIGNGGSSTVTQGNGGAQPKGGAPSNGGSQASGGAQANGGTKASGGNQGSGGSQTSGGAPSGGGKASGGSQTSGGAPSGGSKASGGTQASGGSKATGGSALAGGATGVGGGAGNAGLPALHTDGAAIKDPSGKIIVLRGISLPDIGTLWAYNGSSPTGITARIDKLTSVGMSPHVIRMPVYPRTCFNTGGAAFNSPAPFPVGTAGGNQTALTADDYVSKVLKPAVDYATGKGMYVIIDYHQIDNTNGQSAADATTFWTYMAGKFASYSNVLYEVYNEPIDTSTTWATFKSRAQGWVDTVRSAAPNNIIIVPSMSWDQKPGDAADSPLSGTNLAYSAHVYPGNWTSTFKQQVAAAVVKVPVFFTEWGYILNGGDQNLGTSSTTWGSDFRSLVDGNGASWTAWVADGSWTPNMFADNNLTTLTDFGNLTKSWLSAKATSDWL